MRRKFPPKARQNSVCVCVRSRNGLCVCCAIAAMNVADSLSPTVDMECRVEGILPTDMETPSSLLLSSETACGLKQIPPDTPTATPTQQLECNGSPPQLTAPPTKTPMEVEESGETSCEPVKSTPVAVSETLTKVKKTKREREALRLEREQLRAEAQAVREEERLKKEEARLKRELEKKARRERREQEERARQERKEAREREKREKQERKETEKHCREEEEKKRREEKRRAELEKQLCAEEKIRKQHKAQELFSSFFSKVPKTEAQTNGRSENERRRGVGFDASVFDGMINNQTEPNLSYLTDCLSHRLRTYKPRPAESDDVIVTSSPNAPPRPRMKLLQFHSNVRPPYFGSWRKKSEVVSRRAPFRMDKSVLDYEFDSDDEWEEEEPGESVSSASEGEESGGEESGGEEGEEDGFFVPHGYLSEDEGERSESEGGGAPPGTQMDTVKAKARAWEAEFQRTCQPKKPMCIGCVWVMGGGEGGEGRREDQVFLSKFSALVLTESPVRVEPLTPVTTIPTETHASSVTDNLKRPVPEEAMPDLIRLVHQSTAGLGKLVKTFQAHWGTVLQNRAATGTPLADGEVGDVGQGGVRSTRDHGSPPAGSGGLSSPHVREGVEGENHSGISKRQLEKKIQQIAVKELRLPSTKQTWYVHDAILEKYQMDRAKLVPLFPPTPKSSLNSVAEKSCSPEAASLSTPVSKKGAKRRAAGNTPTLFEVIAKSPQAKSSATAPAQKRLKLVPSPARSAAKSTGDGKPPKKRIRLESLSLKSPRPPEDKSGASGSSVIIIDDSSSDTHSVQPMDESTNTTVSAQPMDNSTPSTTSTVSVQPMDDSTPSTGSTEPMDNLKPLTNTTVSVQPTDNSKPSTNITTPSRKAQIPLPVKRLPQIPAANQQTTDNKTVFADTKCLQEVTNSQISLAGTANSEDGGKNGENRPHNIDWQKLLTASSSNSNKVMVIADIH